MSVCETCDGARQVCGRCGHKRDEHFMGDTPLRQCKLGSCTCLDYRVEHCPVCGTPMFAHETK